MWNQFLRSSNFVAGTLNFQVEPPELERLDGLFGPFELMKVVEPI